MHYKFLKKLIGAFGYKLIDKNLVKNERLISNYTYLTIDKILEGLFSNQEVNSVIQIGSNDGKRFDNLNYYINKYNPKAIFVEPIKSNYDELKKNYPNHKNFTFENLAISVDNEINELFKVKESKLHLYDDHILGITSFDFNHLIRHGVSRSHIQKEKVDSISITNLLKKHFINNFDLLFVDTEGYDANIVFDFLDNSEIKPIIFFEYIHTKNQILDKLLKLLKKRKYSMFKVEENIFCLPKEKKIDLNYLINNPIV
jgi:FkbM family methyltransferase